MKKSLEMKVKIPDFPDIPENVARIPEIAYNLWWSWSSGARELFRRLDKTLWRGNQHNPVKMLQEIAPEQLAKKAADPHFQALYSSILKRYDKYMDAAFTWYSQQKWPQPRLKVAYFCAEFGIHNSLPIYSGGLGLLAGDTCKEASDLGLPMVAIGSIYKEGYFHQHVGADGTQEAIYTRFDTDSAPILPVLNGDGSQLLVEVPLGSNQVHIAVWRVQVGRVPIYLMDTDIEENPPWLRDLSARLYQGDQLVRLRQEIILGMGGVRVLRVLGEEPTVFHLNEGHAAFAGIELLRERVQAGETFQEALEKLRSSLIFTTHTPVKAGHDEFPFHMMEEYFQPIWEELGVSREQFFQLGRPPDRHQFSMTILALRTSRAANAVSKRHGEVSREMWHELWPDAPVEDVPIVSITNGVHLPTWISAELAELYERCMGPYWWERHDDIALWEKMLQLSDSELWQTHCFLKGKMLGFVRDKAREKWLEGGVASANHLVSLGTLLDRDTLTIGFARRFATYKRATLILKDLDRLLRILKNPWRPVQIIFSGKAHPADEPGKYLLRQIVETGTSAEVEGHVALIEDYDKHVAHYLLTGVDVWLNNPEPPNEASGTSGQKASLNGIPNLSVLDGWWYEGYNGYNGWAIEGEDEESTAESIYDLLENEIVPLFYDRDPQGVPQGWTNLMKQSIWSVAAPFSARRMVKEYVNELYVSSPELVKAK